MLQERLKEMRLISGLTQAELARRIGVGRDLYNKYERAGTQPSNETLVFLANELNSSVDYLLGKSDNPASHITSETKKEPTLHDELVQEFADLIKLVPAEKLSKVKNLLFPTVDAII